MQLVLIIAGVIAFICAIKIFWITCETPDNSFYENIKQEIDDENSYH